jgi:predicted nucleic acid-binding protein
MLVLEGAPWRVSARDSTSGGDAQLPETNFMNDKAFVDTNILVYAHDRISGIKNDRARALIEKLWSTGGGVISTQVLQELCINLRRKSANPLTVEETRSLIEDYLKWEIVVNTPTSVIEALANETRYQISFWDALIIHAAESASAAILYSEDLSDGQIYGSVRVVNPLTESASD